MNQHYDPEGAARPKGRLMSELHSSRPPTIPTVHLNGTSYDGLFEPLCEAGGAIRKAITALQECAPHGRDYYLQGEGALAVATSEHLARVSRLQSVLEELQVVMEGIAEKAPERRPVPSRGRPEKD